MLIMKNIRANKEDDIQQENDNGKDIKENNGDNKENENLRTKIN
jgi:hypothetical protein